LFVNFKSRGRLNWLSELLFIIKKPASEFLQNWVLILLNWL
jgi:hypothetical protein